METTINYWAILTGAVLSMVLGFVWYGPLFSKKWMEIIGINPRNKVKIKAMQKHSRPLYLVQFLLTLFQVLVLAHLIADTQIVDGIARALWICAAFVIPTLAGTIMWTQKPKILKWQQFLIQSGYQLIMYTIYGIILQIWG